MDKLELLGRQQLLLVFDDDHAVFVDGLANLLEALVVEMVQIHAAQDSPKLLRYFLFSLFRFPIFSLSPPTFVFFSSLARGVTIILFIA